MTTKYEHDQERWRDEKEMLRHSILGSDEPECPKCGSTDYDQFRHEPTFSTPEATYWVCWECGYKSEPE